MDPAIEAMLDFLEKHRIRATYQAVGEVVGAPARAVGKTGTVLIIR